MSNFASDFFITPASGTVVIPIDNPKGIHLWGNFSTSDDVNNVHAQSWHGFSDGVLDVAWLCNSESNAVINTQRETIIIRSILILDPTDDSVVVDATVAMSATEVTITFNTFAAGHRVHYAIFGGADVQATVVEFAADSSPVASLSFTSALILLGTAGNLFPGTSIHAFQSFGAAHDNGVSIDQWCLFAYMGDNDLDSLGSALASGEAAGQYNVDFANWTMQIATITATGFSWTGSNADECVALCIDWPDGVEVGTFAKATGAAPVTQALPALGFTPAGYFLSSASEVLETINVNRDCRISHGAFDGGAGHSAITTRDNVSGTDAHSRSSDGEVLQLSQNLNVDGVQASATPNPITDDTPDFEWDPNTAAAAIIGFYALDQGLQREQEGFQWRKDDANEADATNLGAQDENLKAPVNTSRRLRWLTNYASDPPAEAIETQERRVGDADSEWRTVI